MIHLPHTKVTQQTGAAAPQRGPRPIQTSFHDLHTQGGRGSCYSKLSWWCESPRDVGLDHVCPCPISLGDSPGLSWRSAAVGQNQSLPAAPAQMNWQRLFSTGGGKKQIQHLPLHCAVKRLASPWLRFHPAILRKTEKFHFNW